MDQSSIDLAQLFGIMRRRARLMLVTMAVVMAGTVLLLMLLRPSYTATTLILIDPAPRDLLADTAERGTDATRIESAVEILGADATLLSVVDRLGLATEAAPAGWALPDWLGPSPVLSEGATRQAALRRLRGATTIQRRGITSVIAVNASHGAPEQAALLANTLAEIFIERQVRGRVDAILAARAAVDERLVSAQIGLSEQEAAAPSAEVQPHTALDFARTQSLALARMQVQTLLARRTQLDAQADLQLGDARIVSHALEPTMPAWPNRAMILAIGAVLATGLAFALALLRENVIGGFVSVTQLRQVLKLRDAASLGRHRDLPRVPHPADLMIAAPLSAYAEAVRRIELTVLQAMRRRGGRQAKGNVVLVTSVTDGEGKSTLALALARAHTLAARTALLIDCNLRRPDLATLTGVRHEFGLRDYLEAEEGRLDPMRLFASDPHSLARLALGVAPSTGPTDYLLGGRAMARLVDAARQSFDLVILDASSVTTVVDPLYLVAHADAVVLLVRYAETSQSHARAALAALQAARPDGVEIVGVLTQTES